MKRLCIFLLSILFLPISVSAGYILHVGDRTFTLSQTKYTTPSLAFEILNDGVWYGTLTSSPLSNTLKLKQDNITYSLCEPFVDTENYTYDENGRLIGANPNIWIEGTGTQYIDTGHNPTTSTRSEIILRFANDWVNKGSNCFFGVYDVKGANNYWACDWPVQNQHLTKFRFMVGSGTDGILTLSAGVASTKQTASINAQTKTIKYSNRTQVLSNNAVTNIDQSIYLFAQHYVSSSDVESAHIYGQTTGLFIYNTRIYEDDVLVKHFVPVPACMRIGDFVVPQNGMWDIVNQQFYGNSGTGEFIYGKDE